jgi:hypothetical protein
VKHTPVEDIVGFLSFSRDHRDRLNAIEKFTPRQWKRALQWLDDAGLAFYFLQKLKDTNATVSFGAEFHLQPAAGCGHVASLRLY